MSRVRLTTAVVTPTIAVVTLTNVAVTLTVLTVMLTRNIVTLTNAIATPFRPSLFSVFAIFIGFWVHETPFNRTDGNTTGRGSVFFSLDWLHPR